MATSSPVTLPMPAPDVPLIDSQTGRPTKALFDFAQRLETVVRQLRKEVPSGISLSSFTTTDLAEGSNRYFTDERVDDRVAALIQNGTGITWTYNDAAGWLAPTVTITQYTDELAQDAVGGMLADTATIDFTYNDGTATITADVKNDSITYAKLQNVSATDRLLGRSTAGAGDVEEIVCTAAGRALIDDANATAQRATLGLGTAATQNTGTSGANVPLLNGTNTWSGTNFFAAVPNLQTAGGTGAGVWYDGSATTQRTFLGMDAGVDNIFRGYSAILGANYYSANLTTGAVTFNYTVTVSGAAYVNGVLTLAGTATPSIIFAPSSGATHSGQIYQSGNTWAIAASGVATWATMDLTTGAMSFVGPLTVPTVDYGASTGQKELFYHSGNIKYGVAIQANDLQIFGATGAALSFGHMSTADGTTFTPRLQINSSGVISTGTWNASIIDPAYGGTGNNGGAWTAYTPTVTGGGVPGAFAGSGTGRYRQIGKTVFVVAEITVTNVGTASYVAATWPVAAASGAIIPGQGQASGAAYNWNYNTVLYKYDGTVTPVVQTYILTGCYEAA